MVLLSTIAGYKAMPYSEKVFANLLIESKKSVADMQFQKFEIDYDYRYLSCFRQKFRCRDVTILCHNPSVIGYLGKSKLARTLKWGVMVLSILNYRYYSWITLLKLTIIR